MPSMRCKKCLCIQDFADEFAKERADYDAFDHGKWIDVFGSSSNRFMKDKTKYTIFRLVEAVAMTAILLWSFIDSAVDGKAGCWLVFLTHQGLLLQTAYFWCALWTTRQADLMSSGAKPVQQQMPKYCKASWILQDLVIPGTFLIVILYWALVVPFMDGSPTAVSYFTHGVNFLMVLFDIFLSCQPYYLAHGVYVGIWGALYFIFSLIYYAADGTDCEGNKYIYKALDWNNPGSTATLGGILLLIIVPFWNLVFWFLIAQLFPGNYQTEEPKAPEPKPAPVEEEEVKPDEFL